MLKTKKPQTPFIFIKMKIDKLKKKILNSDHLKELSFYSIKAFISTPHRESKGSMLP